jgi:hypothetical protein
MSFPPPVACLSTPLPRVGVDGDGAACLGRGGALLYKIRAFALALGLLAQIFDSGLAIACAWLTLVVLLVGKKSTHAECKILDMDCYGFT